ncbi:MAG: UDP-N-acetylenolpyruvoylglucosamine reductase [Desulfuromonas sp.]|nr:MAG: UDP-N-acetylenolpyruvoylglucosamine reductase [Desulfuromonas sp.]
MQQALRTLTKADIGRFAFDVELARHCSWKIGGPADLLVEPGSSAQVATIMRFAREHAIPLLIIGQGTNLLFADDGVRGIVMKIGSEMGTMKIDGSTIVAGSGLWVPRLARAAMKAGLTGLEHCSGIPGTLGGLVMMNGGSRRKGIGDNLVSVTIVDRNGCVHRLSRDECAFAYRHSALQGSGCAVVEAELLCELRERSAIRRDMLADLCERRGKFPLKQPNCGSVFLSSAEMHASVGPPGKIIEAAGLKGLRIGQAEVSHQHANFIVNLGGASAADVLALIREIRARVRARIAFELDCEVRYVSSDGRVFPAHIQAEHSAQV